MLKNETVNLLECQTSLVFVFALFSFFFIAAFIAIGLQFEKEKEIRRSLSKSDPKTSRSFSTYQIIVQVWLAANACLRQDTREIHAAHITLALIFFVVIIFVLPSCKISLKEI